MKKKWIAVLLTGAMLATAGLGGTMTAFAGITKNKPAGDGLTNGAKLSNDFIARGDAEPSSYEVKAEDYSLQYKNGLKEAIVNKAVPKETMQKDDAKVILTYTFTHVADKDQLVFFPAVHSVEENDTYGFRMSHWYQIWNLAKYRKSQQDSDPVVTVNTTSNITKDPVLGKANESVSQNCVWNAHAISDIESTGAALIRFEMTVNEGGWVDVTIRSGSKITTDWSTVPYSIVTNWAPYDGSYDFRANLFTEDSAGLILDGAKLEVSYTEDGDTKNEVLFETNIDDKSTVVTKATGNAKENCLLARDSKRDLFADSEVLVTNPQADFRFATISPLVAGEGIEKAFDMTAALRLLSADDGVKVGIVYGLPDEETPISKPKRDVSFLYLTKAEGGVALGVDNIDADGNATEVGTVHTVEGAEIGEDAAFITLAITGKSDGSITVKVNEEEEALTFEDLHLNGHLAFTHTGKGSVTYGIKSDSVSLTGYEYKANVGKAVTSNFDGNFLNLNKFDYQTKQDAIASYMTKGENTTYDLEGLLVKDNKVGFYGTGTNTRLMFKEQYADFVLQFDYTSFAYKQRGQLVEGGIDRYSPLYLLFGIKGEASIVDFKEAYALGIVAGNNSDFYGDNESIIVTDGKLQTEGIKDPNVLSKLKTVAADQDDAIALWNYKTKKPTGEYAVVDTDTGNGYKYSLYNTTSRVKLVVVNNTFVLYVAPIQEDGTVAEGAYIKAYEATVTDALGYVGFATDVPGWCAIDNVAITPVGKEEAIRLGLDAELSATEIVADILPSAMAKDLEPTPLEKLTLTQEGTKIKWNTVAGAKEYRVTASLAGEQKLSETVTETEIDLASKLTEAGDYTVRVVAVPADADANTQSNATIVYKVSAGGTGGKKGCGGAIGGWAIGGLLTVTAAAVLVMLPKRKKNK